MDTVLEPDRLREFVDLISSSLDEDIDGSGIAARGCLSRYHFDRLVSAAMGESPGSFRRRLMLERAAWEIGRSQDSITRIALQSGFRSPEGFSRAFKRAFKASPVTFRRRLQSGHGKSKTLMSDVLSPAAFRLAAPNGVHFRPPGGITVPGPTERITRMDIVDRLINHDLWFTHRLLDKATSLPDESLDKPVLKGMPLLFGEHPLTTREILGSMVGNKERWSAAITGRTTTAEDNDTVSNLKQRLETYGSEFKKLVNQMRDRGSWDDGFVDAVCQPPESFTYGGMLSHVITFSAYRRDLAILAFRELGVDDLGIGDPIEWERQAA